MPSTFSARKDYICTHCHRETDSLMHFYEETLEVLVFGQHCQHCRRPSQDVDAFISGIDAAWTVHDAGFDLAWCMQCDTPTSVDLHAIHDHIRDVHPEMWAALP